MVAEVLQLLVVIGLLVVVDLVEHHTIHYRVMGALEVVGLDMVVQVIEISPFRYKENKVLVVAVVDLIFLLHLISIVELQTVVPVS